MMKPLRIALTKGRLEKDTIALLEETGIECAAVRDKGRKLILPIGEGHYEVVLAKAADVITYVEHGVCDIGVVGKDTILERGGAFYEIADLGFGRCRFVVAGPEGTDIYGGYSKKIIATKYPNVAHSYFYDKGLDIEIIKIEGSVELAPLLKLSDAIVDIVETGSTLKENGLVVLEEVAPVSARLIVNAATMKLRHEAVDAFASAIQKGKENSKKSM